MFAGNVSSWYRTTAALKAFSTYAKRAEKIRSFNQRCLTGLNTQYSMIGSGVTNSYLNTIVTNELALNDLLLHTPLVNHLSHPHMSIQTSLPSTMYE